jgi:hypothetical protein
MELFFAVNVLFSGHALTSRSTALTTEDATATLASSAGSDTARFFLGMIFGLGLRVSYSQGAKIPFYTQVALPSGGGDQYFGYRVTNHSQHSDSKTNGALSNEGAAFLMFLSFPVCLHDGLVPGGGVLGSRTWVAKSTRPGEASL